MPKININGVGLYYEEHGQGYPVIFLHGFSSTHQTWLPQIPDLSREVRFITYDARGHGLSDSPETAEEYSADIVVEDLVQLLGYLEIDQAVVGGLSMGGYESLRFYLTHPQKVKALIIMDTGPGYKNPKAREVWNQDREALAKQLETKGIEAMLEEEMTEARRAILLKQNPTGLAHMARKVVAQHDSWVIENLSEIKIPTLLLVGESDTAFIPAAHYMAKKITDSELIIIPKAGHSANVDNPQAFNRAVIDFLGKLNLKEG